VSLEQAPDVFAGGDGHGADTGDQVKVVISLGR
jgi:hypothetical protein